MRRPVVAISSLVLIFSGLGMSPANAVTDGTYPCDTGTFTVVGTVVTANTSCQGEAVIPEGVTSIGISAFQNNTDLDSVVIPESVTSIELYAFLNSSVKTVTFVAGDDPLTIADAAFQSSSIRSFTFPARVTSIGSYAFGNLGTSNFYFYGTAPTFAPQPFYDTSGRLFASSSSNLDTFTPPTWEGLSSAGLFSNVNYDPKGGTAVRSGVFGHSTTTPVVIYEVGAAPQAPTKSGEIFSGWSATNEVDGEKIDFPYTPEVADDITLYALWTPPFDVATGSGFVNCSTSGYFFVVDNVVTESESCLGTAAIPDSVTEIFERAFEEAEGLTAVTFGAGSNLDLIGDFAFQETDLESITIPAGVKTIGYAAFRYAGSLEAVTFASNSELTNIGDLAFQETDLESVTIPAGVRAIGRYAFADTEYLETVTIEANSELFDIGNSAFSYSGLGSITIPAGVLTIEKFAFRETSNLETVTFAADSQLKLIGEGAFRDSAVQAIEIPAGVTNIMTNAFYRSDLSEVNFAANSKLIYIGYQAFYQVEELSEIEIPASVTAIEDSAFREANDLARITFAPGSKLSYLGDDAFRDTAISSIQIPAGVKLFREGLFEYADDLESIYFLGNAPVVTRDQFKDLGANPKAFIKSTATGFPAVGSLWNGLTVEIGVYDVAFNSNGGSAVASDAFVAGGAIATPETPEKSGFTLAGWSATDGGDVVTFPYSPGVSSNITLFAKWTSDAAPVVDTPVVNTPAVNTPAVNTPAAIATGSNASLGIAINFSAKARVLTKAHKAALKRSVKASGKNATYVVTGTAGMLPGTTKAQVRKLANLRANVIKAYLVKLGVNKANISIKIKITNQGIVPKTKTLAKYLVS